MKPRYRYNWKEKKWMKVELPCLGAPLTAVGFSPAFKEGQVKNFNEIIFTLSNRK